MLESPGAQLSCHSSLKNLDLLLHVGSGNSSSVVPMASGLKGKLREWSTVEVATRAIGTHHLPPSLSILSFLHLQLSLQ